jgi:DNA replication and repair protein RecF
MLLNFIKGRDFRNFNEFQVDFHSSGNLVLGRNAQGKSNLLEAIYFLTTGQSFRTSRLADLIKQEKENFFLESSFTKSSLPQSLKVFYQSDKKAVFCNETKSPYLTSLLGGIQGVLMSPEDEQLIKGSPQGRRKFLDIMLSQIDPLYVRYLFRYYRSMKQRNVLLKERNFSLIAPFENQMAQSGAYIISKRELLVSYLQPYCQQYHTKLSGSEEIFTLTYKPCLNMEDKDLQSKQQQLLEVFSKDREREALFGSTLKGPHKDELAFVIDEQEAKYFSSQGQKRCCLASLRLAQWHHLKDQVGEIPLLLIDDFGTSLDPNRSERLFSIVKNSGAQWFLTMPENQHVPVASDAKKVYVDSGSILETLHSC